MLATLQSLDSFLCLTRQRKLSPEPAHLESDGYLIYPFLSYFKNGNHSGQIVSVPQEERTSLFANFQLYEGVVETEFSKVFGSTCDLPLLRAISELLHAYFSVYELDRCAEKSVYLLMQKASETATGVKQPFDVLKELNWRIFGIRTISIGAATSAELKIQSAFPSNFDPPQFDGVSSMLLKIEKTRQNQSAILKFGKQDRLAHAIPLRYGEQNRVSDLLMLVAESLTLPLFAVRVNEQYIRTSVGRIVERRRQQLERKVQREIISPQGQGLSSQKAFDDFCGYVVRELAALTNSHSVTIRRFRAFTNSLDLASEYSATLETRAQHTINCDPQKSVNAFCYQKNIDGEFVYIPDISQVPEEYRDLGLLSVLKARTNTKSEICLPIGKPPLRLGTLNLESPNYAAYELDIEFLQSMAFYVSQHWKSVSSVDDAWWLSQLSLTHLATHELRDFKETLDPAHRRALEHIVYTISPAEHFHKGGETTWASLLNFVRRQHNKIASPETLYDVWKISGFDENEKIGARLLGSLRLIVHAVLSNTRHSDYARNSITITLSRGGAGRIVTVEYRSNVSYVDPETLEEIEKRFSMPALSSDGWHFGLFLIGVHARVLGGDIEIDPSCRKEVDYSPFAYMVRIPIPEAQND